MSLISQRNKKRAFMGRNVNESLRLPTSNINSLEQETGITKERGLKEFLTENIIDIAGIQETNLCWHLVAHKDKIWDSFRKWKEVYKPNVAQKDRV